MGVGPSDLKLGLGTSRTTFMSSRNYLLAVHRAIPKSAVLCSMSRPSSRSTPAAPRPPCHRLCPFRSLLWCQSQSLASHGVALSRVPSSACPGDPAAAPPAFPRPRVPSPPSASRVRVAAPRRAPHSYCLAERWRRRRRTPTGRAGGVALLPPRRRRLGPRGRWGWGRASSRVIRVPAPGPPGAGPDGLHREPGVLRGARASALLRPAAPRDSAGPRAAPAL